MSPRPYRLGHRQASADETRARILAAARELIISSKWLTGFSIDAIARRAGVARMTVYYRFGSKAGLLEALFDDVAAGSLLQELPRVFELPDPVAALAGFVEVFGRFWTTHRIMIHRLAALATLDHELDRAIRARNERRRAGLSAIVQRLPGRGASAAGHDVDSTVEALFALTSFAFFDALAGPSRTPEQVTPIVQRLIRTVVGIP